MSSRTYTKGHAMYRGIDWAIAYKVMHQRLQYEVRRMMDAGDVLCGLKRRQGHFLVLKAVSWEPKYEDSECEAFQGIIAYGYSWLAEYDVFELPFDKVARSKAYQSLVTGLPSHELHEHPWMYQPSWTRYGGSAVLRPPGANISLITAYSGGSAEQDRLVAELGLQLIVDECQRQFEADLEADPNMMWIGGVSPADNSRH